MVDVLETATTSTSAPATRAPRRGSGVTPYLYLLPYALLFTTFTLVPAGYGLWISLHEWDYLLPGKPFIGLDNYQALFDSASPVFDFFWQSMQATAIFTVFSVPLLVVVPLGIALILNRSFRGRTFFRAVYFAPYVLSVAVIGVLWRFLLDPNLGAVNALFGLVGLPDDTAWTTGLPWAWVSLVGVTVWWTLGFNAVIYLAGLQDIPGELYEAAKIDGAGRWEQFRYVTWPGLRPTFVFVAVTITIAAFGLFVQIDVMTRGGPLDSTGTIIFHAVQQGFRQQEVGYGAAISLIFFVLVLAVSLLQRRLTQEK